VDALWKRLGGGLEKKAKTPPQDSLEHRIVLETGGGGLQPGGVSKKEIGTSVSSREGRKRKTTVLS